MDTDIALTVTENTRVTTYATFTNELGVAMDPTTTTLKVRHPTSTESHVYGAPGSPVTRNGAGDFQAHVVCDEPGRWWFSWHGEGNVNVGPIVVREQMVLVEKAIVP